MGADLESDIKRCAIVREELGPERYLMVDANQKWDVQQAIDWMKHLVPYKPWWIEEPTSPDDVLGHATIRRALKPYGIGVATGEHCQNRVMFKQLLQAQAIDFCQIDSCRLGGVNEVLAVYLMAHKFGVPVCPHAGGVGLCEYVQHLALIDYICIRYPRPFTLRIRSCTNHSKGGGDLRSGGLTLACAALRLCSGSLENRVLEYVDHLHEHFEDPCVMRHGHYMPPTLPGYSITMKPQSLQDYEFPTGKIWSEPQ